MTLCSCVSAFLRLNTPAILLQRPYIALHARLIMKNIDLFIIITIFVSLDVDECSPVSDCMHICENTFGSYTCKCNSDFKVDDTDPKNCVRKCSLAC